MSDLELNRKSRIYPASSGAGFGRRQKVESVTQDKPQNLAIPAGLKGRTVTVTLTANVASKILGAEDLRRGLFVQNLSANDVYLSVGTEIGANNTDAIKLPPNTAYEFPAMAAPVNEIYARSEATSAISFIESVLSI